MNYNFKDRTGERYGNLTVIERDSDAVFDSGKLVRWKCRCDCGNETIVLGCNLSKTKSCGCKQFHKGVRTDLTGKRFGILTVIEQAEDYVLPCGQHQKMWKCKCDCGSVVIARSTHQKDGATRSCGCIKSHGEREVAEYLDAHNIHYIREYEFDDCINSKGNKLPFDFAIMNDDQLVALIEYQGEQHFYPPDSSKYFGKMQREETDKIKKEYCLTHNIPLHEIRFDESIKDRLDQIIGIA